MDCSKEHVERLLRLLVESADMMEEIVNLATEREKKLREILRVRAAKICYLKSALENLRKAMYIRVPVLRFWDRKKAKRAKLELFLRAQAREGAAHAA